MSFPRYYYRALAVCLGAALWAGCGTQYPPTPTTLLPTMRSANDSRMARNATSQDLLYVTGSCGGICVLTYPGGTLVGQIADSNSPYGECVDKAGDVFVADFGGEGGSAAIVEYAHGGTKPIATLSDPGYYPESCSIDPITGNLAVTNENGPVAIYAGAKGDPTYYSDAKASLFGFCAYDDKGNLFVNGEYVGSGNYALVEMPKGGTSFKSIKLENPPGFWYDIQWAGKYLAIADSASVIYHVAINGTRGTIVGSTLLNGPVSGIEVQFWIHGGTIIEPYGATDTPDELGFWKYPTGGKLRKTIGGSVFGGDELLGTVVSPVTSR